MNRTPGRGAVSNVAGRYEKVQRQYEGDGWSIPEMPVLRTHVTPESARRIITYNRSPDLPFDRSINVYRGCEHGCIYCFARPSHAWLGLSAGLDFETRLTIKPDAPDLLRRELAARRYVPAPIAIGTNTDPYQPLEKDHELTRACLGVLAAARHPVAIVTKGALIERDIDILAPMARDGLVRVGISITTQDRHLSRLMEPRVPDPARRFKTIARLHEAGIPVRVMMSPVIPALTDPEIETLLDRAAKAGADAASWIMLRLPCEVSPLFQEWLAQHYPDRARRIMGHVRDMHGGRDYDANWGTRMRGQGPYAAMIAQRFARAARGAGLDQRQPKLRTDLFRPPKLPGTQAELFER